MKILFLASFIFFGSTLQILADSPLGSTPFYEAYNEIPIIYRTALGNGIINKEIADYLSNKSISVDKKAALINALSQGDNANGAYYTNYLLDKYSLKGKKVEIDVFLKEIISPDELFCFGYLGMFDSLTPKIVALKTLVSAINRNEKSYTVNMVWALCYSETIVNYQFDNKANNEFKAFPDQPWWSNIYLVCAKTEANKEFEQDLRIQAKKIIFYYINGYKKFVVGDQFSYLTDNNTINELASDKIHLQEFGGVYKIPVRINESFVFDFIFDSGASDVVLSEEVADKCFQLGILSKDDIVGESSYRIADGSVIQCKNILIKRLDIGFTVINNIKASIGGPGAPLLLGQSLLKKFDEFSINNRTGVLTLMPKLAQTK
jgi:clan AA aspartic protease (TIGR02281 family)